MVLDMNSVLILYKYSVFCSSFLERREINRMTVPFSDKWPCVLQYLWHGRQEKNIKTENGWKMTRYGVCLILERGEVSLPEGLQQWMSWHWYMFLSSLLVIVAVLLYTLLCFEPLRDFSSTSGGQTAQESAVIDGHVCPRGWRGRQSSFQWWRHFPAWPRDFFN